LFRQRNLLGWLWLYYLGRLCLGLWDMCDLNVFNRRGYTNRFGLQLSVPDELHSY